MNRDDVILEEDRENQNCAVLTGPSDYQKRHAPRCKKVSSGKMAQETVCQSNLGINERSKLRRNEIIKNRLIEIEKRSFNLNKKRQKRTKEKKEQKRGVVNLKQIEQLELEYDFTQNGIEKREELVNN
tara:strand:- start:264 stop:647 length:384 start_codon:yes stop_codon:yes gene_type:complete